MDEKALAREDPTTGLEARSWTPIGLIEVGSSMSSSRGPRIERGRGELFETG